MPMPSCEHCPCLRDRNSLIISSRPHIGVFMFLITVLVTLVAANVEGRNNTLFEKHGINMWSFLVALGGFCVAVVADLSNSQIHQANLSVAAETNSPNHEANYSRISGIIVILFGLLSTVSLVSTFLPQVVGYIILSISWICAAIFLVVIYEDGKLYKGACQWIFKYIMKLDFTHIRNNNWFQEATNNNMVISSPSTEQTPGAILDIV